MYRNILVAFDASPPSETALIHAARLAKALGARLRVAYVEVDPALYFPLMAAALPSVADMQNALNAETLAVREAALDILAREGVAADFATLPLMDSHMHIADRLLTEVRRVGADLVVTGSHGRRSLARVTLGSEASLHAVRVGMQVAPPHSSLLAIYVEDRGVDVSELEESLLTPTPAVPRAENALAQASAIMTELGAKGNIERRVSHTRLAEDVAATLLREAQEWEADLVVVGAQDRHGLFSWFNGHENERVARAIDRPLLVVNQAG